MSRVRDSPRLGGGSCRTALVPPWGGASGGRPPPAAVSAESVIPAYRCKALAWDLDRYRVDAESFLEELDREYYLHLAGHKPDLALEPIYERHAGLFERDSVERIAAAREAATAEEERRLRYLHQFAFDGHLGAATRALEAELAELEATLEVEVGGESMPYRTAAVVQANEPDAERRAELEAARNGVLAERLNPLHRETLEVAHASCA